MGLCCSSSERKCLRKNPTVTAAPDLTQNPVDNILSMPTPLIEMPITTVVDRLMHEAEYSSININQILTKLHSKGLPDGTYDEHDNVEDPILVWIDTIEKVCDDLHIKMKLIAEECGDRMLVFTDLTECIHQIQTITSETLILIVFNSCAADIIPIIHYLVKIHSIFVILEFNELMSDSLSSQNGYFKMTKIEADCVHFKLTLRQQLCATRQRMKRLHFYDNRQKITRDLTCERVSYMWFQLMIEVFKKMTDSKKALEDMVHKCLDHYVTNPPVRKSIEQFEEDMKDVNTSEYKAITWYSQATFVHRLVNKALRTEDICQLYALRFIIAQLSCQLASLRKEQFEHGPNCLTLFHGCHLSLRECEHLESSVGKLISINFFLSTSLDENTAAKYGQVIKFGKHEKQSVMFKITVDTTIQSIVFASIAHLSKIRHDDEVLFDVGTTFVINNVTRRSETQSWLVELTGSEYGSILKNAYIEMNRREVSESNAMLLFGKLLIETAHFSKANEYFVTLLDDQQIQTEPSFCASVFYYIGVSLFSTGDFLRAFHCYMAAFTIQKNMIEHSTFVFDFARTVNSLGVLFSSQRQFQEAHECHHYALHLLEIHSRMVHPLIASTFMDIGTVYRQQEEYGLALAYHLRSLDMFKEIYFPDHPDVIRAWINVCIILDDVGEHSLALRHLEFALNSIENIFPPNHPLFASIYSNLGSVYFSLGNTNSARDKYLQALYIFKRVFPPFHTDIATTLTNIGSVYEKLNQLQKALEYYQKAWQIRRLILPLTSIALRVEDSTTKPCCSYKQVSRPSMINRSLSFNEAARLLPSGPPIDSTKSLSVAHVFLAESFLKIGHIYALDKQWALAYHYCSQAMTLYEQIPDKNTTVSQAKDLCSNIIRNSKSLLHTDLTPDFS